MSFFRGDPANDSNPKPGLGFADWEALIRNPGINYLHSKRSGKRSQRLRHKSGSRNDANTLGQKTFANDEAGVGFVEAAVGVIYDRTI
jgi:hypothetical protein